MIKINIPKGFTNFCINFTNDCNLRCRYCWNFGGEEKNKTISWDFIKSSIDFLSNQDENTLKDFNVIVVGGGEQTLEFGLLKKTFEYLHRRIKNIKNTRLSTNGVINDKQIDWIVQNISRIQISCDGPPFIQDKERPFQDGSPTSQYVENTIKKLVEKSVNFNISSVLTSFSVQYKKRIIKYFAGLGVKRIVFRRVNINGRANKRMSISPEVFLKSAYELKELGRLYDINISTPLDAYAKEGLVTCGIPFNFCINNDNKIYSCLMSFPEHTKEYEVLQDFKIGEFENDEIKMDEKRVNFFKRIFDGFLKTDCSGCNYFKYCFGGCPYLNLFHNGNMFGVFDDVCETIKTYIDSKDLRHKATNFIPYLEKRDKNFFLNFMFSKFSLDDIFILRLGNDKISEDVIENIKKADTYLILVSPNTSEMKKDKKLLKENLLVLDKITEQTKIPIIFTRPIPPCLMANPKIKSPKSCKDCLELFYIENYRIKLCDGQIFTKDANEEIDRKKVFKYLKKQLKCVECKNCRYNIRNQCFGFCEKGVLLENE